MTVSNLLFFQLEFAGSCAHRDTPSATALPDQVTAQWHLCNSISEQTGAKRPSEMQQGRAERVAIFALEIKTCQHCSFSCKPDHTQAQQRWQAQAQEANEILSLGVISSHHQLRDMGGIFQYPTAYSCPQCDLHSSTPWLYKLCWQKYPNNHSLHARC